MGKGLYLEFEIKRPNRVNRYMDYVLMLGLIIVFAVFFIYKPYVDNIKSINEQKVAYNTAFSQLQMLESSRVEGTSNVTNYDRNYEISYNKLDDATNIKYATYFSSLLKFTDEFTGGEATSGFMNISSYKFNNAEKTLVFTLTDNSGGNHTISYINALREDKVSSYDEGGNEVKHPLYWVQSVSYTYANSSTEVTIVYGE